MSAKFIELRPDRNLLKPDFEGYKLSLDQLQTINHDLQTPVNVAVKSNEQYSLLHVKMFGVHNHLIGETVNNINIVYFIDKSWSVCAMSVDPFSNGAFNMFTVWDIPVPDEQIVGDYNCSLKFANDNYAVASDGMGNLYVAETGKRSDDYSNWNTVFVEKVLHGECNFIIQDVYFRASDTKKNELHCLLITIVQDNDKYVHNLHWITLTEIEQFKWGQTAMKQLKTNGEIFYSFIENNAESICIISENGCKFTLDSENAIVEDKDKTNVQEVKIYSWTQDNDSLTVIFKLPDNIEKKDLNILTTNETINVQMQNNLKLEGTFYNTIDSDLTTWTITNKILKISLMKNNVGLMWPELIPANNDGEYFVDEKIASEIHTLLSHLCSDKVVFKSSNFPAINDIETEECDFHDDKCNIIERLNITHEVTHRCSINSQQLLFHVESTDNMVPAIVLRQDVDACIWQPQGNNSNWCLKHEGTLLAFGYIQASKQEKKFLTCAPDFSYAVVCESNRHIFIYRQKKYITSGELRNRTSGRRITNVAQQQVINLGNDEVLGINASNYTLFILTENKIHAILL